MTLKVALLLKSLYSYEIWHTPPIKSGFRQHVCSVLCLLLGTEVFCILPLSSRCFIRDTLLQLDTSVSRSLVFSSQGCGGWNRNGPHWVIDLSLSHRGVTVFERIKKCSLVKKVFHWRVSFKASKPMSTAQDIVLGYFCSTMSACCHTPHRDDNELNFSKSKQAPIKCFLIYKLPWFWCLFIATEQWLRHGDQRTQAMSLDGKCLMYWDILPTLDLFILCSNTILFFKLFSTAVGFLWLV